MTPSVVSISVFPPHPAASRPCGGGVLVRFSSLAHREEGRENARSIYLFIYCEENSEVVAIPVCVVKTVVVF